jgi:hypothetical protein
MVEYIMNIKCIIYTILALAFFLNGNAYCSPNKSAEEFVYDFYMWYGNETLSDARRNPLYDDTLYKYVSKCTVDRLRIEPKKRYIGSDYFLKGNDFWRELLDNMKIGKIINIYDDISIVPVIFGEKNIIFVFLKKENNSWSIIKVEDAHYDGWG